MRKWGWQHFSYYIGGGTCGMIIRWAWWNSGGGAFPKGKGKAALLLLSTSLFLQYQFLSTVVTSNAKIHFH